MPERQVFHFIQECLRGHPTLARSAKAMGHFVIESPSLAVDSCLILPLLRQAFMRRREMGRPVMGMADN